MDNNKEKRKITHLTRFAYPHLGGVEAVIDQINDCLSSDDFEKVVFCCSNVDKSSYEKSVKFNRCRYLFDFAANSISPQMFFKLMFLKTDVLHFHMPVIQNVIFWLILRHLGLLRYKKMTVTYHSDIVGYDKYMTPFWGIYKYFLSKADKIHVLSPNIIESSKLLKPFSTKCVVIPQGISLTLNHSQSRVQEIKEKYKGKKIIFSLGRLVKYKGFIYGIKAMEKIENAIYLIGGSGPLKGEFESYINEHNLQDKVVLLGRVDDNELENYYSACDIYLFPSVMQSEAFGIVQLEAMKHSKPVINTWLDTGVNYVSQDNKTGLTVDIENVEQLQNAINKLLNDDELRLKFAQNARKRVEEVFNLDSLNEKYSDFFSNF